MAGPTPKTRGQIKTLIRNWLGTGADDALYGDTAAGISPLLDPAVQQTVDGLLDEINLANKHYLSTFSALVADSPTSHLYTLPTQPVPITNFAHWLELRVTDETGSLLEEARLEEMTAAGSGYFCVTGPDEAAVIQTSGDTEAGIGLWLRYGFWPDDLVDDTSPIQGIPAKYHDVVALEALFVYGVGGESSWPAELRERRQNRHAALIAHVSKRGIQQNRTRLDVHADNYLG